VVKHQRGLDGPAARARARVPDADADADAEEHGAKQLQLTVVGEVEAAGSDHRIGKARPPCSCVAELCGASRTTVTAAVAELVAGEARIRRQGCGSGSGIPTTAGRPTWKGAHARSWSCVADPPAACL